MRKKITVDLLVSGPDTDAMLDLVFTMLMREAGDYNDSDQAANILDFDMHVEGE